MFVAVLSKNCSSKHNMTSGLEIYYMKDPRKPIISISQEKFLLVQSIFYIRDHEEDKGKVYFTIKGTNIDYQVDYEFKDKSLGYPT